MIAHFTRFNTNLEMVLSGRQRAGGKGGVSARPVTSQVEIQQNRTPRGWFRQQVTPAGVSGICTCQIGKIKKQPVISRNNRPYLRVWDREAPALTSHKGLHYFPIDAKYQITALYQPFETPRSLKVLDAIGGEHESRFPGQACFTINGLECTLIAEEEDDGLLFNFTDLTRADSTYPGGRYLLTEPPAGGTILLDFNLARNWPCAYTAFATCPLAPAENHLKVRIEAGEMRYHD